MRIGPELLSRAGIEQLEAELLGALAHNRPAGRVHPLHVTARDTRSELVGAMVGSVSYGWLHVEMLWVRDEHRNRGLGTRIMLSAEQTAGARGCHGAWLDTSSEPAHRFYLALGYQDFGMLENRDGEQPAGHRRWFLQKRLT